MFLLFYMRWEEKPPAPIFVNHGARILFEANDHHITPNPLEIMHHSSAKIDDTNSKKHPFSGIFHTWQHMTIVQN